MSAFEKSQSQYERKMARQRQLDLMEAAVGGVDDDEDDDDDGLTTRKKTGSSSMEAVSQGAMENARRFLWDEDEEDQPTTMGAVPIRPTGTSNMFSSKEYAVDQSINLMDPALSHTSPKTTSPPYMASVFRRSTGPNDDKFHDAASSGDSEEYITDKRRRDAGRKTNKDRLNPVAAACMAVWHTCIGGCALCCEALCSPTCKRVWIALVLLAIVGASVAAIVITVKKQQQPSTRYDTIKAKLTSISSKSSLGDTSSPQYQALNWLVDQDKSQMSPDDPLLLERYALAVLFYSTSAESKWKRSSNWMTDHGYCMWEGVQCLESTLYDGNGKVLTLNLTQNALQGTIPSELVGLAFLNQLDLSGNALSGAIPSQLAQFSTIEVILLNNNQLKGSIPTYLGTISVLRELNLAGNGLRGKIPSTLNSLVKLRALSLYKNQLTGSIPDLSKLTSLRKSNLLCLFSSRF